MTFIILALLLFAAGCLVFVFYQLWLDRGQMKGYEEQDWFWSDEEEL